VNWLGFCLSAGGSNDHEEKPSEKKTDAKAKLARPRQVARPKPTGNLLNRKGLPRRKEAKRRLLLKRPWRNPVKGG